MANTILAGIIAAQLFACGTATPNAATGGSAPSKTLASGTTIELTTGRTITSRSDKAGQSLMTTVNADVRNSAGRVIIPAGSAVELTITQIEPAKSKSAADGQLTLAVAGVSVGGHQYPLDARITSVDHTLEGRGVTAGEVEKVAAGAAIGAVAGRIIGGDSKGTIIGAAAGTAGGAIVANETASRDVVVAAGSPIVITLTGPLAL